MKASQGVAMPKIALMFSVLLVSLQCLSAGSPSRPQLVLLKLSDSKLYSRLINDRSPERFAVETIPELQTIAVLESDPRLENFLNRFNKAIVYSAPVKVIQVPQQKPRPTSSLASDGLGSLWGMKAIEAEEAWKKSQGEGVIVAVSDTGIYKTHPDLKSNLWQNPGERGTDSLGRDKATNKVDDDNNGHIDDTWGWAFNTKNNNPNDEHYHGTHVAGTIAAPQNGLGVVGAAPKAKLMAVKFLGANGSGTDLGGAQSIVYAAKNGAKIINCSWGGGEASQVMTDAVAYAQSRNVLIVAAAGNDGLNTDRHEHIPSGIDLDNVISVGATANRSGSRAGFSNFGPLTVDLAAPGVDIKSTFLPTANIGRRSLYAKLSGTSMAAPHVSGVAALIWSAQPQLTYLEVKQILMEKAAKVSPWQNRSRTEGVLNAKKSLETL
jgi:subtilisin family serine protease